ncbi:MAG: preprotein translocase subunit SecG [Kiritimatiellae bacterium]|nr:preprotein translocase subunit SecG [Kiritimatiellia bacterium]
MQVVRVLLIVLEALVSLLLIGVILLQRARNEGLGLAFGSGMGESIFGSRAGNVLTKITVWLGAIFVVNTVVLAMLYSGVNGESTLMREKDPVPVPIETPVTPATPVAPVDSIAPNAETMPDAETATDADPVSEEATTPPAATVEPATVAEPTMPAAPEAPAEEPAVPESNPTEAPSVPAGQ